MRYGFIGLGNLGAHLAASLLRAGFTLTVHDRNAEAAAPLQTNGARWAESPKAVAGQSDAVITCLPSPAVSEQVLTGSDGILAGLRPGGAWIEMSTLGRDEILRLATKAAEKGVATLEAPVTGGVAHTSPDLRFSELGVQLSRGFRALKVWFSLRTHGADLHGALVAQNVAQAAHLAARVTASEELELMAPVPLNVVCFRYREPGLTDAELDLLNERLLVRLQEDGIAVPSSTVLRGRFCLRVAITNHRTRRDDLEALVAASVELGRELGATAGAPAERAAAG